MTLKVEQDGFMHPKDAEAIANSADPHQTAPLGAVAIWSGSALFAQTCLSKNLWTLQYLKIPLNNTTKMQSHIGLFPDKPLGSGQFEFISAFSIGSHIYQRIMHLLNLSHLMTKSTKWPLCTAKTKISLGIPTVWGEPLLSTWRNIGSSATQLSPLWRLIRLCGCSGWSESSLGAHIILLVLSWGGSFDCFMIWQVAFKNNANFGIKWISCR